MKKVQKISKFNQQKFNEFILENNIVGFSEKPVIFKSGRKAYDYINWRNIAGDVFLLDELADYVIAFVEGARLKPDCFYGVPEGAIKLGVIVQYKWAKKSRDYGPWSHRLSMGRKQPKDHGCSKDRYFIGEPKGKTIVLEDVTTTGESLFKTIDNLKFTEAQIIAVITLTNRMELRDDGKCVKEAAEERGLSYFAMSNALELLPKAYKKLKPGKEIGRKVEEYFQKYGIKQLKLL